MSLFSIVWLKAKVHTIQNSICSYRPRRGIGYLGFLMLLSVILAACSLGGGDNSGNTSSTAPGGSSNQNIALANLHWCGTPSEVFRDQASPQAGENVSTAQLGAADGKARNVSDWNTVKANLGFTLYLPPTMPEGTCLLSVASSLRDPVFGSNFTITYILADHNPVSFSLAPVRNQRILPFQCSVSQESSSHSASGTSGATATATDTATATPVAKNKHTPLQVCTGVQNKTSIVFSAYGQTSQLQQMFQSLQPNINWVPSK